MDFHAVVPPGTTFVGYVIRDDRTGKPHHRANPDLVHICRKLGHFDELYVDVDSGINEIRKLLVVAEARAAAAEARAAAAEAALAAVAEANQQWQETAKAEGWPITPFMEVEVEVGANSGHQETAAGGAPVTTVTVPASDESTDWPPLHA